MPISIDKKDVRWLRYDIVISGWHSIILIFTKDVKWLLYDIVISDWHLTISIDTKDVRRFLYINRNRFDLVGLERNLDVSRETFMFQKKPWCFKRNLDVSKETLMFWEKPGCYKRNKINSFREWKLLLGKIHERDWTNWTC